jgi:predicted RNA-binding Zn-ribbon protein involved in translation (DUF1610 family)
MICKAVSYDLAIQEWANLLDSGSLPKDQCNLARAHLAGLKAEKEMAYHLNAMLADNPELMVFNNLKIAHGDRDAQIDHLILSRWTAYFIETKSVSERLNINDDGQWARVYDKSNYHNIESPLAQSQRHEMILFDLLESHLPDFMGKLLGFQLTFRKLIEARHYVALLPKTNITGKGKAKVKAHIEKVDLLPRKILDHHQAVRASLLGSVVAGRGTTKRNPAFSKKEFEACKDLLSALDVSQTPLEQVHQHIESLPTEPICPECGETMVLRTARQGERKGEPFYGCPRYPKCRAIVNIE